ncbi:glycosyl hydrolase family 28-related protein [Burkholderia stagnalis]
MNNMVVAQTRTQIGALDPATQQAVTLVESGRGGLFVWKEGNFSSQIAADSQQGIYVPSSVDPNGGAWERIFDGPVSVKWFGALGDGASDDTVAIQGAINFVESKFIANYWSTYYGEVYLPTGDYLITGLSISAPLVFGGSGSQACSISLKSGSNNNVITLASPPVTLPGNDSYRYSGRLHGFSINGNGSGQSSTSNGIYLANSQVNISQRYDGSAIIEDVIVRSIRDVGVYIGVNRNYGTMRNVSVVYCNTGVQNNGYDWRISECDFGNSVNACYWQFEGGATFIGGTNIYMSTSNSGLVISSMTNAPCMISGCYIDSNAMNGIYVEGDETVSVRHNIINNIFRDNSSASDGSYAHIFVKNLAGGAFEGNSFVTNESWRPGYLVYIEGASKIVWSGSYAADGSPQQPFAVAVSNAPGSLIPN